MLISLKDAFLPCGNIFFFEREPYFLESILPHSSNIFQTTFSSNHHFSLLFNETDFIFWANKHSLFSFD